MKDYLAMIRSKPEDALHYGVKGMKWGVRKKDGSGTEKTLGVATVSGAPASHVAVQGPAGSAPKVDKKSLKEHQKTLESMNKTLRSAEEGGLLHPNSETRKFQEQWMKGKDPNATPTEKEIDDFLAGQIKAINKDAQKLAPEGASVHLYQDGDGDLVMFVGDKASIDDIKRQLSHSDLEVASIKIPITVNEYGLITAIGGELMHYGIKGMRWGIRRTDKQLAADTQSRKAKGEPVTPTKKAEAATSSKPDASPGTKAITGEESSAQRYARLTSEAKGGGAKNWSEQDLKFYNSRTEALAKVDKMFQSNPSWLRATTKKVLQQAAQNTMQSVADGVAKKYITTPILDSIPEPKKK